MDCNNYENFKPTTGKVINTAYDIGDIFWTMVQNKPVEIRIYKISIVVESVTYIERYCLEGVEYKCKFYDMQVKELNNLSRTKEELMKKVFE